MALLSFYFPSLFTGNKLDSRHMETLEEIFRRVQFKNLDFEDTNMDDDVSRAWHGIDASIIKDCILKASLPSSGCVIGARCFPEVI